MIFLSRKFYFVLFPLLLFLRTTAADDAYLHYIQRAPEFRPVKQDPATMIGRWDTWIYMPWRYQWSIGTGEAGGQFCRDYGFNGGFTDHGEGPLAWLEKWQLRFYNDHTAGKGFLYLRGANRKSNFSAYQRNARMVRRGADGPQPIDKAMLAKLEKLLTQRIGKLKQSPMRVAYALDDEISWGAFVTPLPWRLNTNDKQYQRWLALYYGEKPPKPQYVTPDFTQAQLGRPLGQLDFSPLLDRITYNDSLWANFIGRLVESANRADPHTPCGFVGGQSPNMWGGFDYAKLMKKIQFIEAYNLGSSQAIIRSFNPKNAMPQVTTHFHRDSRGVANDIWQSWYYFAHGNRGMVGWVEGWFDAKKNPQPWLKAYRSTLKELGERQGPKLVGSRWIDDGVAIYYSHPSIQVSWCLDIEPHGKTWVNRNGDHRLGTSHLVRKAWEHLLTDSGIQYNFLAYDQVVTEGVPQRYKVLILPACYALSDIEATHIRAFCRQGGTVIADFGCGLFDQHGKGRTTGALDDMFGVMHNGSEKAADFFAARYWVETNQDAGYNYKKYRELFNTLSCRLQDGYAVAERRLKINHSKQVSRGRAVYLNLSPQRYLQYRQEGTATEKHREVFLQHVFIEGSTVSNKNTHNAGIRPWLQITSNGVRPPRCEATYWAKGNRTYVFIVQKAEVRGSSLGGGGAEDLVGKTIPIEVAFPAEVTDMVNERSGRQLGNGRTFSFDFPTTEAVLLSFRGRPPQGRSRTKKPD